MARSQAQTSAQSVLGWEEEGKDEEGEEVRAMCKVQTHVSVPGPVWARIVIACGAPDNSPECVVDYVEMMSKATAAMSEMIHEAKEKIAAGGE